MANEVYNSFKRALASGIVSMETGTFKLLLTTSSYTFSQSHTVLTDVSNEISSTNYSAGGKKLENATVFTHTVENKVGLSGSSISWTQITATPYYGILYLSGSSPSTSLLVEKIDFNGQAVVNADFTVNWNSEGILTF